MVEMLPCLYIQYVVEPQFSVESVWVESLALVQNCWWNTTNRLQHPKQGRLESNQHFFFFMYHRSDIWTTVSPVRWVVGWFECTGCLVSKGKAFVLHLLQETNYEVFWMSSWRRRLEDDQLWEWRSVQHWEGPRGLWSISASAMTFRNPDIPWQDRSNKK